VEVGFVRGIRVKVLQAPGGWFFMCEPRTAPGCRVWRDTVKITSPMAIDWRLKKQYNDAKVFRARVRQKNGCVETWS